MPFVCQSCGRQFDTLDEIFAHWSEGCFPSFGGMLTKEDEEACTLCREYYPKVPCEVVGFCPFKR